MCSCGDDQRMMLLPGTGWFLHLQAHAKRARVGAGWIVMKHEMTFKQRHARRDFAPPANLDQRAVLVLTRAGLLLLKLPKPCEDFHLRRKLHADRQSIDE